MGADASDRTRKIADEALAKLASELEAGKSEALRNYLAVMGRFRRYSWNNVLLIANQRPDATRVAGFHAWHDLGRSVKKGEKGIMILAPMVVKRGAATDEAGDQEASRLAGFRTAYVFDVSQTEGKPLPEFSQTTGDPKDATDRLKAFAAKRDIVVEYDSSLGQALGVSSGGRIRLKPDLPKAEEFAVLAHEIAHELLHHGKDRERLPKVVRETQAEAVAFVVSHAMGLETNHAAADYIALYSGDETTLRSSLSAIQATASQILGDLLPNPERAPNEDRSIENPQNATFTRSTHTGPPTGLSEESPTLGR